MNFYFFFYFKQFSEIHGAGKVNLKYIWIIESFSTILIELGLPVPNLFLSCISFFYFVAQSVTFRQQIQCNIWSVQGCFIKSVKKRCSTGAFVSAQTDLVQHFVARNTCIQNQVKHLRTSTPRLLN